MKKIFILLLIVILIIVIFPKQYTSSIGRVTEEARLDFEKTRKSCVGFSLLTNRKGTWGDAPGRSLCFGWLK